MTTKKNTSSKSAQAVKDVETTNQAQVSPEPIGDYPTKQVNVGLSESNKMQPDAGIQAIAPTGSTATVIKTDPYTHQTKEQEVLKEDGIDKVSKKDYDNLLVAFNEVLDRVVMDVSQKDLFKAKAGIK